MTLADMRKKTIYGPETDLDDAWNATNADHGIFSVHRNKDLSLTTVVYDSDYRHRFDVDTTPEDSRVLLVGDDALTAARAIIGFELASNEEEKSYFAALKPSVRPHVLNKASKAE